MKQYHKLVQGTPEWKAHRSTKCNASDAPAMLDISQYKSRDALMKAISTGEEEVISPSLQQRFDDGHKFEKMARPFAEEIIGEELFSPTISLEVDGVDLSASFDGATMMEDVIWEHKTLNAKLAVNIPNGIIDPMYAAQMEQQLLISGAEKCLFMASKGTKETMVHTWYESNPELRAQLIAGWKQFTIDLAAYTPTAEVVAPTAKHIEALPSLQIMVQGSVTNSNLIAYSSTALGFIESINTELQTDDDFANAENTVKFLKNAEAELKTVRNQIFSQTADIEQAVNTIDHISESARQKRLSLEKLIKSQKLVVKTEIIQGVQVSFSEHMESLLSELNGLTFKVACDFAGAIKGKSTLDSIRNAANTELAQCKIKADGIATLMRHNLVTLGAHASEHRFLFNDLQSIINKPIEDFELVVISRIKDHKIAEEARLEKEREQMQIDADLAAQKKIDEAKEQQRLEQVRQESLKKVDVKEPVAEAKPPVMKAKPQTDAPTSEQIIGVLANYYETDGETIVSWLQKMDFQQLAKAS